MVISGDLQQTKLSSLVKKQTGVFLHVLGMTTGYELKELFCVLGSWIINENKCAILNVICIFLNIPFSNYSNIPT